MEKELTRFILQLSISILLVFGLHILILSYKNLPLFDNKIILAYTLNYLLALSIFIILFKLREKLKNQLGFLFIAGSFLKFILFFTLFYPFYKIDQEMSTLEFSSFFTPYIICLIIEVFALSKMLNKLE